ncbi:MAG: ATPase P [Desulfitobacteriaceae bacterium]|nr:ATPase P [Desulfitobacteriaceae bacterium]MDD4752865.1 ATPase P [Desulfitobacteriaceae bacterium]
MLKFQIPGWGDLELHYLVLDFNGTIGCDGRIIPGVKERLETLSQDLDIYIISADTFGTCAEECEGIPAKLHCLDNSNVGGVQKEKFVQRLGLGNVVGIGNGANDVTMLGACALGIAVLGDEGLCTNALTNADLIVKDICDALDLLIYPKRLVATLRR